MISEETLKVHNENLSNKIIFVQELQLLKIDGMDKLLESLKVEGFFKAPASTRFHGSYIGGLLDHSVNVFNEFMKFPLDLPRRTKVITCLLHDVCKTKSYISTGHNFRFNPEMKGKGHATYSISIIERFFRLTEQEKNMIKFHMGWYGIIPWMNPEYKMGDLLKGMNIKEVKALHLADELATQFIDK